jgi:hypothetical protein
MNCVSTWGGGFRRNAACRAALLTALREFRDGMRRPASSGMRYAPNDQRTRGAERKTGHEEEYH